MKAKSEIALHPAHYVDQSVLMEPIDVLKYCRFDLGNCLKYLIRAGHKDDKALDLEKAAVYLSHVRKSILLDDSDYFHWWDNYGELIWKFQVFADKGPLPNTFYAFLDVLDEMLGECYVV